MIAVAAAAYDDMENSFGAEMYREIQRTGLTLAELAHNEHGLFEILLMTAATTWMRTSGPRCVISR